MESASDSLSKLTIARDKRPRAVRRGWLGLAATAGVVAAIAGGAGWWYYRTTGMNVIAAMTTETVEVDLLQIPDPSGDSQRVVLVASGKIVSDIQIKIATKVSGQIVEMLIEQGDAVQAGQVLARIEDVTYRALRDETAARVQRQRHDIARARSELARTKATVIEKIANHEFEQRNFGRLQELRDNGQIGDLEYFNGKNKFEMARAALEQARAAVTTAAAAVQVAESDLASATASLTLTQKRLDDCDIRSPIDGIVLERNAQVGDFLAAEGGRGANANAQLVEIADMQKLRVEVDISERDVQRLSTDQPVRVTPDANRENHYDGYVMWVDPLGDYARATVQSKVRIREPGPDLRIGGSAKIEFLRPAPTAKVEFDETRVFWLPKAAIKLTPEGNQAEVFTILEDHAVSNRVRLGARTLQNVEVLNGVRAGMQIISAGLSEIEDGTPVRVRGMRVLE